MFTEFFTLYEDQVLPVVLSNRLAILAYFQNVPKFNAYKSHTIQSSSLVVS